MNHDDTIALVQRCRDLLDIESVSRNEADIESYISAHLPLSLSVVYKYDSVMFVAPKRRTNRPLVVFAGHTDTVPVEGNLPSVIERDEIIGRGASDMKAGLAVMIELARWIEREKASVAFDVGFLFFGREELAADECPLLDALQHEAFRDIALAVVMEPTANKIEAGCMGNLNLHVRFDGVASHSARPWLGDNAINKAISALQEFAQLPPSDVDIDGLIFRETASITKIHGGVALNVIPATAEIDVNIRYAPTSSADNTASKWIAYFENLGATATVTSNALPAPVATDSELVQELRAIGDLEIRAKQAWTNVSDFAQLGIAAVNFGPGNPSYAHKKDERVTVGALEKSLETLQQFVSMK